MRNYLEAIFALLMVVIGIFGAIIVYLWLPLLLLYIAWRLS